MEEIVTEVVTEAPEPGALSWSAVFAGALVILASGALLFLLGVGFGLSAVSPWPNAGASAVTVGAAAAIWLVVMHWVSSGLGGYVAGRMRPAWQALHDDESYFRDTAHGIVAWSVASVLGVALTAAIGAGLVGAIHAATPEKAIAGVADDLLRTNRNETASTSDPRPEVARIVAKGVTPGSDLSEADRAYLAQLVAARTGETQVDARKHVDDTIQAARQAADVARKALRNLALITGFSMLIGAFIAGVTAKIAGHHRDDLITS